MAMEVPMVATTAGGIGSVLRHDEDAVLVTPGSAAALENGLIRLLESDDLCRRLVHAARARVERNFDFRARMRKVVAVYDALLAAPAVPG
jgi:glycosyltransferase involved in cell wall biosynthesis